jgi:type II secretory pathway component PulM
MTTQITSRDKKLLYILGIIVIVAMFYILGIRPLNKKIDKTSVKLDDAQITHDTIEAKLYHLEIIKSFEEKAMTMAEELSSRYYEKMPSSDVDKLITNKALGHGLKVINLGIRTGKEPVVYNPYVNSEEMTKQIEAAEALAALAEESEDSASSDEK